MIDFSEIQRKITSKYSIDELEARLKPGDSKWKEDAWSDHSSGGFLAPTENLMDVVRADYDTLRILGKSYEEMANYASCFLKQVEKEGYHGKNALVEGISKLIAKHWKPLLKSTEFSTGLGPVAKNATSHGENSGSPKESGRAKAAERSEHATGL
ncbi:hypothetical protein J4437_01030 [Candidatus Woesearchaeota archaeon]|nr:hypothetical protein [Candidatus Woesearchaeota archaeon]